MKLVDKIIGWNDLKELISRSGVNVKSQGDLSLNLNLFTEGVAEILSKRLAINHLPILKTETEYIDTIKKLKKLHYNNRIDKYITFQCSVGTWKDTILKGGIDANTNPIHCEIIEDYLNSKGSIDTFFEKMFNVDNKENENKIFDLPGEYTKGTLSIENYKSNLSINDKKEEFFFKSTPIKYEEAKSQYLIPDILSDENLLYLLNGFKKKNQKRNLDEKEIADLIDTRNKLIAELFNGFDNQLETIYGKETSIAIFDRIVNLTEIEKNDFDLLKRFRNKSTYSYQHRALIVSGLTLSLLNVFDPNKIDLLIDFVTDFEDVTWKRALVGLLFALIRYENRLSLYPGILRRLNELKYVPDIQNGIIVVDDILRNQCFSSLGCYNCAFYAKDNYIKKLQFIIGNNITITKEDIIDIQKSKERKDPLSDIFNSLLTVKFDDLIKDINNKGSVTLSFSDWLEYLNIENYIKFYDLNPFALDIKDELFSKPQNWFYPINVNDNIDKLFQKDYPLDDVDISDFVSIVNETDVLSDVEKVFIMSHIKEFSEEFLYSIIFIINLEKTKSKKESKLKNSYVRIIRDIYRFVQTFSKTQNTSFDKISGIYNKSLLDKITDEVTQKKIDAQFLYEQKNYQQSIDIMQTIPESKYDFTITSLFAKNYIGLEKNKEAIPYLDKVLDQIEEQSLDERLKWYVRAGSFYLHLDDNSHCIEFMKKEIQIREDIFEGSEYYEIAIENAFNLADSYLRLSVVYLNRYNDYSQSLYYTIKYLNAFFLIPNLDYNKFQEKIDSDREWLFFVFSSEVLLDNYKYISTEVEKELDSTLISRIHGLFNIFSEINDLDYKASKFYSATLKHANCIYEEINLYVNLKKKAEPENKGEIFHFISKGVDNKVVFPFNDILQHKSEGLLKSLVQHVVVKRVIYSFFNNLLSPDDLSYESIKDIVMMELLDWHLWDYNKLVIWRNNLVYTFNDQKESIEFKKVLKRFENILEQLNEQPIEEQTFWIYTAYDVYSQMGNKKQALYYAIKYLNALLLIPDLDNNKFYEIIDSDRERLFLFFSPEYLLDNFKSITTQLEKEINSQLIDKIQELYDLYTRMNDFDFYKTSKHYDSALKHAKNIYKEIYQYFQNKKEMKQSDRGEIFHFISNENDYKVYFLLDDIIQYEAEGMLRYMIQPIFISSAINSFFENLFLKENVIIDDKEIALLELLDYHFNGPILN